MATVNKLLAERGAADTRHRQSVRQLAAVVGSDAPNRRTIMSAVTNVEISYDNLVQTHVAYVLKLGASMDNQEHQTWIDQKGDNHANALEGARNAVAIIDADPANVPAGRNVEEVRDDITDIELSITALHTALQTAVTQNMNQEQFEAQTQNLSVLETKLTEHRALSRELRTLDVANQEELRTTHNGYQAQKIPIVEQIKVSLAAKRPDQGNPGTTVPPATVATGTTEPTDPPAAPRRHIKFKPTSNLSFSGKAKDYTRFVDRFDEQIAPYYDESAQLDFMEASLPTAVKGRLSMVKKTVAQIRAQLDSLYNDPKVILKEAVSELYNLSSLKLKSLDMMVKLCTTLVDTEALLDSIHQGDYLRHPREVAALEDLLPTYEAQEYIRRMSRLTGNEYEKLKSFLTERKEEILKLEKLGTKSRLDYVDIPKSDKSDKPSRGCFRCGDKDHMVKDCPEPAPDKENKAKDGKSRKPSSKGGQSSSKQETQTNTFRSSNCRRCSRASQSPKPCPGYQKQGTDLLHCLGHCSKYTMESVNGRTEIVKKAEVCVVCLGTSHQAGNCNFREKESSVCGLDGCKAHHHPTLHGSKDRFVTSVNTQRVKVSMSPQTSCETFKSWTNKQEILHKVQSTELETQIEIRRCEEEYKEMRQLLTEPMLNGDQILLLLQKIEIKFGIDSAITVINGFIDNGSTCSLILTDLAEKLNLLGHNIVVNITTVNGEKERHTKLYIVELLTSEGERKTVRAIGVDSISGPIPYVNLSGVKGYFSPGLQERWEQVTERPEGEIQLLIGSEEAGLHPTQVETISNLVVAKSMFGNGWAIHGHHPELSGDTVSFSEV